MCSSDLHYGIQAQQDLQSAQTAELAALASEANATIDDLLSEEADQATGRQSGSFGVDDLAGPDATLPPGDSSLPVDRTGGSDALAIFEQPSGETVEVVQDVEEPTDKAEEKANPHALSEELLQQYVGFVWLLIVGGLFVIRLLIDPTMVRRPLLEPNLSTGGLAFMGVALFVFLMANVVSSQPTEADLDGPRRAEQLPAGMAEAAGSEDLSRLQGPRTAILFCVSHRVPTPPFRGEGQNPELGYTPAYAPVG